jgi:molecular chaperone GrpE
MNENIEMDKAEDQGSPDKKAEKPAKDKTVKIKESEHIQLIEDAARYKDQYIRLYAEFENARKRMERDRQDFTRYANEGIIAEFLEVLDNLERSVESAKAKHEDYTAFLKGIEMVMAHIYEMLKKNGVAPIEAKGKMFDPHCHEVLMQEETETVEDGVVLDEFQKGYRLGERVIRTAKVKVAKKKQQDEGAAQA